MSVKDAAALLDVPVATVARAKVARRKGIPEVMEAVERRAITLYAAEKIAELPIAEQPAVLAKALAAKGDGKRMKSGTLIPRHGGFRRRKVGKVLPKVITALGHNADLLAEYLEEKPPVPPGPREEWLESLRNVAKIIGQCQRWLKLKEEVAA